MIRVENKNINRSILERVKAIDEQFYTESKLTLDWYLERYKEYHVITLLYDDDKIVGYLLCVPIKKELYDDIMNGKLTNDIDVSHDMFVKDSLYNYIVSIVIDKEYRNNKYAYRLLDNLIIKKGNKYCALTVSEAGKKLASKYMKKVLDVNDNVSVFGLEG